VAPLILGVLKYLGAACAFRFFSGKGVFLKQNWSKIPEKMKIGGIFSDFLIREMKKGYLFEDACPR
jgi:hypothetical protein